MRCRHCKNMAGPNDVCDLTRCTLAGPCCTQPGQKWRCPLCHVHHHGRALADAGAETRPGGTGTELVGLLEALGVPSCQSCKDFAGEMDAWGIEGCLRRREQILGRLKEKAAELGWLRWLRVGARAVAAGLDPVGLVKDPAAVLLDEALRRARQGEGRTLHVMNHGLGDCVQFTAALAALADLEPDRQQHVAVQSGKASIFRHQASGVHVVRDRDQPVPGPWGLTCVHPWLNPHRGYADSPGTKAAHWLREVKKVRDVREDWFRYRIHVSEEARRAAQAWVRDTVQTEQFVLIHHQGTSWAEHKDLAAAELAPLVDALLQRHVTPVVLDLDRRSPLLARRRVVHLGRSDPVWGGAGTADPERLAALMGQSALNVVIDSGPGKVAAAVAHTPCLTVWPDRPELRELHPYHFSDLDYGQVRHLVPHNHADRIKGDRAAGFAYFERHYNHAVYPVGGMAAEIRMQALAMLDWPDDPVRRLVSQSNRWHTAWPFLESLPRGALVVETGTTRQEDDAGAGMSTVSYGTWLARIGGRLVSVDVDPRNVALSRRLTAGLSVEVVEADSAAWLRSYAGPALAGLYLDSMDVGIAGYQEHCLAEAQAGVPHLAPGAMVLIDDTSRESGGWQGKGALAVPWLLARGWRVVAQWRQVLLQPPEAVP